jgi:hypothetical protein
VVDGQLKVSAVFTPGKCPLYIQFKAGCALELDWNYVEEINFVSMREKYPVFILVMRVTMLPQLLLLLILSTAFNVSLVSLVHNIFVVCQ